MVIYPQKNMVQKSLNIKSDEIYYVVNDYPIKIRPLGGWKLGREITAKTGRVTIKIRPLGGWKSLSLSIFCFGMILLK